MNPFTGNLITCRPGAFPIINSPESAAPPTVSFPSSVNPTLSLNQLSGLKTDMRPLRSMADSAANSAAEDEDDELCADSSHCHFIVLCRNIHCLGRQLAKKIL